jgi:lycopene cyclase domain-containing protein
LNTHYTYLLILAASLAGPLALSFDRKVAFYKKWKWLFPAMLLPGLFYIVWDIFFVYRGVWSFNDKYITGIRIAGLPLEEILFFFLVPFCCLFIYECIRSYFPRLHGKKWADAFLLVLALGLMAGALAYHARGYTTWTFGMTALFILLLHIFPQYFRTFDAASFLVSYAVILVPFLVVNGFLTAIPVVIYNDAENLGIRIYRIPVEDIIYGMLLTLLIVCFYERRLQRWA